MTAPMHKHRPRANDTSLKMRIASSENLRTRQAGGIKITMPKAPWEEANGSERNGKNPALRKHQTTTNRQK